MELPFHNRALRSWLAVVTPVSTTATIRLLLPPGLISKLSACQSPSASDRDGVAIPQPCAEILVGGRHPSIHDGDNQAAAAAWVDFQALGMSIADRFRSGWSCHSTAVR